MIGHIDDGQDIEYAFEKSGALLLGGTVAGHTLADARAEIKAVLSLRPDVQQRVVQIQISLPPGELLTDEEWLYVGEEVVRYLGYGRCPWLMVRHTDTGRDHVHIEISPVSIDGKLVDRSHDRYRIQIILRALERELGLQVVDYSWDTPGHEYTRADLRRAFRGEDLFILRANEAARDPLASATSWAELERELAAVELALEPVRGGLILTDGEARAALTHACPGHSIHTLTERFGDYHERQHAPRTPTSPTRDAAEHADGNAAEVDRESERSAERGRAAAPPEGDRALAGGAPQSDNGQHPAHGSGGSAGHELDGATAERRVPTMRPPHYLVVADARDHHLRDRDDPGHGPVGPHPPAPGVDDERTTTTTDGAWPVGGKDASGDDARTAPGDGRVDESSIPAGNHEKALSSLMDLLQQLRALQDAERGARNVNERLFRLCQKRESAAKARESRDDTSRRLDYDLRRQTQMSDRIRSWIDAEIAEGRDPTERIDENHHNRSVTSAVRDHVRASRAVLLPSEMAALTEEIEYLSQQQIELRRAPEQRRALEHQIEKLVESIPAHALQKLSQKDQAAVRRLETQGRQGARPSPTIE